MTVVVSTLVENSAMFGFLGEWGLGLWVSVDGFQFLFDTGMGKTIVHNADRMGIELSELNALILSHGHVDHTGGIGRVLVRTGAKPVFAHPGIFEKKLSVRGDGTARDISMPFARNDLEELGARITPVTEPMRLARNVYLSGEVPLVTDFERADKGLFLYDDAKDARTPDPMADDLSLAVRTSRGLVILLGCAHRGAVNIIRHFQSIVGEKRVHAIVGGLHLCHASQRRVDKTIGCFKEMGVEVVACSHCTGFRAAARLADAFKDGFVQNCAGSTLSLG